MIAAHSPKPRPNPFSWGGLRALKGRDSMTTFAERAVEISQEFHDLGDYISQIDPPMSAAQIRDFFEPADLEEDQLSLLVELGTALVPCDIDAVRDSEGFGDDELFSDMLLWSDGSYAPLAQGCVDDWEICADLIGVLGQPRPASEAVAPAAPKPAVPSPDDHAPASGRVWILGPAETTSDIETRLRSLGEYVVYAYRFFVRLRITREAQGRPVHATIPYGATDLITVDCPDPALYGPCDENVLDVPWPKFCIRELSLSQANSLIATLENPS